jgi:hypothetical protein
MHRHVKRGWYCTRCPQHYGPCALRPWFWNLKGWWQLR